MSEWHDIRLLLSDVDGTLVTRDKVAKVAFPSPWAATDEVKAQAKAVRTTVSPKRCGNSFCERLAYVSHASG